MMFGWTTRKMTSGSSNHKSGTSTTLSRALQRKNNVKNRILKSSGNSTGLKPSPTKISLTATDNNINNKSKIGIHANSNSNYNKQLNTVNTTYSPNPKNYEDMKIVMTDES